MCGQGRRSDRAQAQPPVRGTAGEGSRGMAAAAPSRSVASAAYFAAKRMWSANVVLALVAMEAASAPLKASPAPVVSTTSAGAAAAMPRHHEVVGRFGA